MSANLQTFCRSSLQTLCRYSADILQTFCRHSVDDLQIICRSSVDYLQICYRCASRSVADYKQICSFRTGYQHAEGNLSIVDRCQGPDDFISKIFLFCFVLRARNIVRKELYNKMAAIFWSSLQMEMLKLGQYSASRLQTRRLGEDNKQLNSTAVSIGSIC